MNKLLDKVFRGIDIFTGILTGAMVLFVFLNVVLRMVFNSGLTWSEELARYLFVAVTYIGAISAMRANAHMTVDMVLSKVKAPLQMTFYVISQSLIAVLMMMLVRGYEFLPIELGKSRGSKYVVEDGKVRLPFSSLKGLGGAAADALEKVTIHGEEYISVEELQQASGVGSSILDRLRQVGALGDLPESSQVSFF